MAVAIDSPTARYGDLCRLCATKTGLTPKGLNIFANEANYRQIFKKIEACLPLQISETDVLPNIVCENCLYKVELLFDFRERALRTEGVLIELFKQIHSHPVIPNGSHYSLSVLKDAALDHVISQHNSLLNDSLGHDIDLHQLSHRDSMIILAQQSVPLDQLSQHDISQELSNHSIDTSESILGGTNGYGAMDYHHSGVASSGMLHDEINLPHNMHQMHPKNNLHIVEHDTYAAIADLGHVKNTGYNGVQRLMMNEAHFMHDNLSEVDNFNSLISYMECTTCGKSFDDKILMQQHYDEHYAHEKELENVHRKELHGSCSTIIETHEVSPPTEHIIEGNILDTSPENNSPVHLSLPVESEIEVKVEANLKAEQYSDECDDNSEIQDTFNENLDDLTENNEELEKEQEKQDNEESRVEKKKPDAKVCTVCGKQYRTNYKLTEHMRKHTGEQPYKCKSCDKAFRSKIGLAQHEAIHTGQYEFLCSTCGKGFQCKSYLMVHQRVHSDAKPFPCTTCNRSFKTKQSLLDHTNRHLGLKPYACSVCKRSFITNGLLKAHEKIHTGADNRKYACPLCDKMFVSKSYLQTHTRIHTGEKPFKCDVCGKGFSARVDLKVHSTMHTGEKSFVCEMCGKAFARRDALRCHRRSHTGERPYKCEFCGQTFTQFTPMAIHKRLHTGERPYECEVCSEKFVSRSTMMVHFKKHVNKEVKNEVKNEIHAT